VAPIDPGPLHNYWLLADENLRRKAADAYAFARRVVLDDPPWAHGRALSSYEIGVLAALEDAERNLRAFRYAQHAGAASTVT
jgi:hypothetical protein